MLPVRNDVLFHSLPAPPYTCTFPNSEHKAYFAVLAVLFQPAACQDASPESLEARRDILKRLKKELHIPDSVSDAVHG